MIKNRKRKIAKKSKNNSGATMTMAGTPLYLAPELMRGEAYDHGVDIYATGATFSTLLRNSAVPYDVEAATSEFVVFQEIMTQRLRVVPSRTTSQQHVLRLPSLACNSALATPWQIPLTVKLCGTG